MVMVMVWCILLPCRVLVTAHIDGPEIDKGARRQLHIMRILPWPAAHIADARAAPTLSAPVLLCRGGYGMLLHLLRRQHTAQQCKHFQSAVTRINNLPHKPLILLPYLFGKQLCPTGASCPHCHAFLLYTLMRSKVTPTKMGVVTEIHSSTNSCVVVWKVPRFRQLTQPTYSFDFRTPQNRVLHMRIDPLVRPPLSDVACISVCSSHLVGAVCVTGSASAAENDVCEALVRSHLRCHLLQR